MAKRKAKGLGDTIDQITTATGIKALVKFVAGEDCGCDQRKEALNKLFPYSKPNCLTEPDYNFLKEFFEVTRGAVVPTVQYRLLCVTLVKATIGTEKYTTYEYWVHIRQHPLTRIWVRSPEIPALAS